MIGHPTGATPTVPPPLLTVDQVADVDEELADIITQFTFDAPAAYQAALAGVANQCGPIAFAFSVYLRANNCAGGLLHVTGTPPGWPPKTGHYMATSNWLVIDWAHRQFDPAAPVPVLYPRASVLDGPVRWRPWTAISGELEDDDPLYPDFVEYRGCDPLAYLPAGYDDPEWTTPWDER